MGTASISRTIAGILALSGGIEAATLHPIVDSSMLPKRKLEPALPSSSVIWPEFAPSATPIPLALAAPSTAPVAAHVERVTAARATTPREQLIGELRRYRMLAADWDGEGAQAPNPTSIRAAEKFASLLRNTVLPEPMLHANGRAGLYWKTDRLYADLEFLDRERISYYIERAGDKHKGALNFYANQAEQVPPVLAALLQA